MQKTSLCAFLSLVFAVSTVHAATAPMVDGVSNGVSTKYNQNCLDVAYKNAYEEADGKKTDSSTFPNYKCYKDGKEIYCNEVREDGQTENAKTDHFVNKLPDGLSCVGVPESQKVYEGSVVSCDDVAYKNGYCKASGVSPCDLSGFKCYQDRVATACSDVTDDAQNDKAEADYLATFCVAASTEHRITGIITDVQNLKEFGYGSARGLYMDDNTHNQALNAIHGDIERDGSFFINIKFSCISSLPTNDQKGKVTIKACGKEYTATQNVTTDGFIQYLVKSSDCHISDYLGSTFDYEISW